MAPTSAPRRAAAGTACARCASAPSGWVACSSSTPRPAVARGSLSPFRSDFLRGAWRCARGRGLRAKRPPGAHRHALVCRLAGGETSPRVAEVAAHDEENSTMHRIWMPLLLSTALFGLTAEPAAANIYTVTTTDDAGTNSLRWAIEQANAHAGPDSVTFNLPGSGVRTIAVLTPLPALAASTSILGTSQPGYAGTPLVRIDGGALEVNTQGFQTNGAGVLIQGLQIVRFNGPGVTVWHDNVTLRRNSIGNDGAAVLANGGDGILCHAGDGLVVGGPLGGDGNVLSGNAGVGLRLEVGCDGAVLWGNRIGTDSGGSVALPNQGGGVSVYSSNNTLGGAAASEGNVISGNAFNGIVLGDAATGNQVRGNRLGTNAAGNAALGNGFSGIYVQGDGNTVGGTLAGAGNVISGNGGEGVTLAAGADSNVVQGNRIGTDLGGTADLGNGGSGLRIYGSLNVVGGVAAGAANVVSGNTFTGITIAETAHGNQIVGNRIGTDAAGSAALPNDSIGLWVHGDGNTLGGTVAGAGNVISGNAGDGVILDQNAAANALHGNRIGTDLAGNADLGNAGSGISVYGDLNLVGGSSAGAGNVVSGNAATGIAVAESASDNQVIGNRIGTNAAGTAALGNDSIGLWIEGDDNLAGGTAAGAGNVVSGNGGDGVVLGGPASGNTLQGNRIGTDLAGEVDLGNSGSGLALYGSLNVVGGDLAGARNLISGNAVQGIAISGASADGNQIVGNHVGTNAAGAAALGNDGYGIRALAGSGNQILRNLISGNGRAFSLELDATAYVVQGNVIGLDAAMNAQLENDSNGLDISSSDHQIGGTQPGDGNVIAGNAYYGVWINGAGATGNVLAGNWIGTNPAGTPGLGNTYCGITISEASGNTVGGTAPGAGNVVAHNGYLGIYVWSGQGNAILGNSIHDNLLLGIELDPQGPVANDPGDWDAGANLGQNFPVVTSALASGGDLEIAGFLDAHPATEYRIELFSNPGFDSTGVGEGENYLGAVLVTTDATGHATFATSLPAAGSDAFVTATATGPSFDTSEFSPAIAVGAPQPGELQIWRDLLLSYEGTPGIAVTVVRSHGVAGTVAVDVATVDGTAEAPDDYGAVQTTLTFQPGETMKSVFVPVVTDALQEADETWRLVLANPQGGAALGANHDVLAWLFNATLEWPMYSIGDAAIVEGDDGTRQLVFTVTLSPTDHDLPIDYWTSNGTAVAGEDYAATTGQLLFHPGDGAKTISVPVLGDSALEADEILYVHLYALGNGVVWDGLGDGRILDDDGGGTNFVFADDFEAGAPSGWSSIVGGP